MTTHIDLEEFVSDYIKMFRDNGDPLPPRTQLKKEIAVAFMDRTNLEGDPTSYLLSQIDWYLS